MFEIFLPVPVQRLLDRAWLWAARKIIPPMAHVENSLLLDLEEDVAA